MLGASRAMLERASSELLRGANALQALVALDQQLRVVLASAAPVARDEVPPWLWNAAWARDAITHELAHRSELSAWRLGDWAKRLPAEERAGVLDRAIDAFEALIPTPVGPGNDAGPFCDVADQLSLAQTRRAWAIVGRMRLAGWGDEAIAATVALARRFVALGHNEEAERLLASVPDDDTHEMTPTAPAQCEPRESAREWNAWLEAPERDPTTRLTDPRSARLVRALAGEAGVELLRERLLGSTPEEIIARDLATFLSDPDPRLAWVRPVAEKERFLPLYLGWTVVVGVRRDQTFVKWNHEAVPRSLATLSEPYWQRLAVCDGVRRHPALAMLVPPRPDAAVTCGACHGAGGFDARPELICACGGLGWLLPGEPLAGDPG